MFRSTNGKKGGELNVSCRGEEIKGYWIGESLICAGCIGKDEAEGIEEANILRESGMDEGAEYFCSRCKKRI